MNPARRKALSVFSLFLISAGASYAIWLAVTVLSGSVRGNVWPGKFLMLLVGNWQSTAGVFKGLGFAITAGLAYLGTPQVKDWLVYSIATICALGFFATGYLFFEVAAITTAQRFWAYSPTDQLQDYQSFVTAARLGLGVIAAWFLSILVAEWRVPSA